MTTTTSNYYNTSYSDSYPNNGQEPASLEHLLQTSASDKSLDSSHSTKPSNSSRQSTRKTKLSSNSPGYQSIPLCNKNVCADYQEKPAIISIGCFPSMIHQVCSNNFLADCYRSPYSDVTLNDDSSGSEDTNNSNDQELKFKTEICRNFKMTGFCKYENRCNFAHGEHELRNKKHINLHYKTKRCSRFFEQGYCPYGSRCQYLHSDDSFEHISSSYFEKLQVWIERNPNLEMDNIMRKTYSFAPRLKVFERLEDKEKAGETSAPQCQITSVTNIIIVPTMDNSKRNLMKVSPNTSDYDFQVGGGHNTSSLVHLIREKDRLIQEYKFKYETTNMLYQELSASMMMVSQKKSVDVPSPQSLNSIYQFLEDQLKSVQIKRPDIQRIKQNVMDKMESILGPYLFAYSSSSETWSPNQENRRWSHFDTANAKMHSENYSIRSATNNTALPKKHNEVTVKSKRALQKGIEEPGKLSNMNSFKEYLLIKTKSGLGLKSEEVNSKTEVEEYSDREETKKFRQSKPKHCQSGPQDLYFSNVLSRSKSKASSERPVDLVVSSP